jgi:signal peptidase I
MNASELSAKRVSKRRPLSRATRVLLSLATLFGLFIGALIACRVLELIQPFTMPSRSMHPTLMSGDVFLVERFSYLSGSPKRGDVIVFRTDGITRISSSSTFCMRVVGLPGERIKFSQGKVLVNDREVTLTNGDGKMRYPSLSEDFGEEDPSVYSVPDNRYFVVGDNSTASFDSRYWGAVPSKNVIGRVHVRYWPMNRFGSVQ